MKRPLRQPSSAGVCTENLYLRTAILETCTVDIRFKRTVCKSLSSSQTYALHAPTMHHRCCVDQAVLARPGASFYVRGEEAAVTALFPFRQGEGRDGALLSAFVQVCARHGSAKCSYALFCCCMNNELINVSVLNRRPWPVRRPPHVQQCTFCGRIPGRSYCRQVLTVLPREPMPQPLAMLQTVSRW